MGELGVGQRPRHDAQCGGEQRQEDVAPVPDPAFETQDERQQVERQRHNPEQRNRRDVLRDVIGNGEQQQRAGGRQRAPQQLARKRRRRVTAVGAEPAGRVQDDCVHRRRRAAPKAAPAGARAQDDEQCVPQRPADRLRARRRPGLEEEGIADQRQHRREIRQCEKAIGARPWPGASEPGLHQRAGGRQQEIRQADRRRQHPEDQPGRVLRSAWLPLHARHDRQHGERDEEQHNVQPDARSRRHAADREIRVGVPGKQSSLEEDEAGGPHRCRTAEPGQDLLGHHRLHEEQQERANEDRGGVEGHRKRGARRALAAAGGGDGPCGTTAFYRLRCRSLGVTVAGSLARGSPALHAAAGAPASVFNASSSAESSRPGRSSAASRRARRRRGARATALRCPQTRCSRPSGRNPPACAPVRR